MSAGHFVTLLTTVIVGIGVIAGGVWRVAAAVTRLAAKIELLAYRVEQIEERQAAVARVPPTGGRGRRTGG